MGSFLPGWVTVIVPTYNRAELIGETLQSVWVQTYRPIEVIIIDDGSVDNTRQIVEDWMNVVRSSEFNVQYLYQNNQGASAARNHGIRRSVGEYIQFLDSDDILTPAKLASQIAVLNEHGDVDFAYGPVCSLENPDRIVYIQTELNPERQLLKQIEFSTFTTIGPLCRRSMIEKVGFWDETMTNFEDWEYFSRASTMGLVGGFAPDSVSYYRMKGPARSRLSIIDSASKTDAYIYGRFRHLSSIWRYKTPQLQQSKRFRKKLARQWIYVTAKAVLMGWSGNDFKRYVDARDIGFGYVDALLTMVFLIRLLFGRRIAARYILIYPWIYFRWQAIKNILQ